MPPQAIQLGFFVLEEAIKEEPAIAAAIRELFSKETITPADWQALRDLIASEDYSKYVPQSGLTS